MLEQSNSAVLVEKIDDLRLIEVPYPTIKSNEVIVQIKNVGICGSDVNYVRKGQCGPFIMSKPMIIGHEASGIIIDKGDAVNNLQIGDRVAIEPSISCRSCKHCKIGRYNLCPDMKFAATPPYHGFLQNFIAHPADLCFKLPDELSLEQGALIEPLSVSIHACKRAGITCGSNVVIIGCGSVGLLASCSAKAFGASKVFMMDKIDYKVAVASEIHADHAIKVNNDDSNIDIANKVIDFFGEKPDVVFDCTDSGSCLQLALECVREGGSIILVGMSNVPLSINLSNIVAKEIDIKGIFRYSNDHEQAIATLKSQSFDVNKIISHHFKMEEFETAFETFSNQEQKPIKIMFEL